MIQSFRGGSRYAADGRLTEHSGRIIFLENMSDLPYTSQAMEKFDVVIIGAGHAGAEAAYAASKFGLEVALFTMDMDTAGRMPCSPSIGGLAKSHLVKEIDALGGIMAKAADAAGIQWRRLNASKGPAVRATRCQADRALYRAFIRRAVESQPGLTVFQAGVDDLVIEGDAVRGVITQGGQRFDAPAVVLTVGTFLGGRVHVGE